MTTQGEVLLPDVYSAGEVARAAGVSASEALAALEIGRARPFPGGYYRTRDAVAAVRRLTAGRSSGHVEDLFLPPRPARRARGGPLAAAALVHAAFVALLVWATAMEARVGSRPVDLAAATTRLVFLATPGPGGGGGGGGRLEPKPPPPAARKGADPLPSPVPIRRPPPPVVRPRIVRAVAPPPVPAEPLPPIVAPVVPAAADSRDRVGVPVQAAERPDSHGPGTGGGAGTGTGVGLGEGQGPGIGPGSGGGTGGGPYRPGSGITPPSILHEVKPDYTEEGRRREIEGDVVLEIVVRRDGAVGGVTLLKGLGAGLDERAIDAVRQWRFSPATRLGSAVDVIVQVAVEFRLR